MKTADIAKHRALEIDPEEYIRCTELRKKVCPVFTEVRLHEQQVRTQWPERAVPTAVLQGAQGMDTLHTFKPTLDGPATMKASTCNLPSSDRDVDVIHDDGDVATEHADASTLPLDLPADFLIGVGEDDAHDPVDLMVVFQKNLELVQETGKRIHSLEQRREQAARTEGAADAAATLAAEKTKHTAALVDLRRLANKMGSKYQEQMTDALQAAHMQGTQANTPRTLHIRSGKPVNMFEASAWPAAFVEFFYGDCAPNLDRPQRVGIRQLFHYLASREGLEYSLETNRDDPLIPEGCYRAPPQSRWNSPEFMAVFADVVRKLRILQTTKHMWEGATPKWRIDIQAICDALCDINAEMQGMNEAVPAARFPTEQNPPAVANNEEAENDNNEGIDSDHPSMPGLVDDSSEYDLRPRDHNNNIIDNNDFDWTSTSSDDMTVNDTIDFTTKQRQIDFWWQHKVRMAAAMDEMKQLHLRKQRDTTSATTETLGPGGPCTAVCHYCESEICHLGKRQPHTTHMCFKCHTLRSLKESRQLKQDEESSSENDTDETLESDETLPEYKRPKCCGCSEEIADGEPVVGCPECGRTRHIKEYCITCKDISHTLPHQALQRRPYQTFRRKNASRSSGHPHTLNPRKKEGDCIEAAFHNTTILKKMNEKYFRLRMFDSMSMKSGMVCSCCQEINDSKIPFKLCRYTGHDEACMHHMCWLCYAAGDFSPNCPCDHRHEMLSPEPNTSQPDEAEPQCSFCVEDPQDQQPDQNQHMQQVAEETMQSWRHAATEHGQLRTMCEVGHQQKPKFLLPVLQFTEGGEAATCGGAMGYEQFRKALKQLCQLPPAMLDAQDAITPSEHSMAGTGYITRSACDETQWHHDLECACCYMMGNYAPRPAVGLCSNEECRHASCIVHLCVDEGNRCICCVALDPDHGSAWMQKATRRCFCEEASQQA